MSLEASNDWRQLAAKLAQLAGQYVRSEPRADGEGPAQPDILASVRFFDQVVKEASALQFEAVTTARQGGASWAVIGAQLNISRQAAQQRFSADTSEPQEGQTRIIGVVSRSQEVAALQLAGAQGWLPVASRHGEHVVRKTGSNWEVQRLSVLSLRKPPASDEGWQEVTSRFPDLFYARPLER